MPRVRNGDKLERRSHDMRIFREIAIRSAVVIILLQLAWFPVVTSAQDNHGDNLHENSKHSFMVYILVHEKIYLRE